MKAVQQVAAPAVMTVPFFDLKRINDRINDQLEAAVRLVMASGHYIMGLALQDFERDFACYCDVKHCLGVGNGLDALKIILQAYDIGPGDEVIVPSNTFIATWLAVTQCGATPVAAEPDPQTFNITAETIAAVITPRTKVIIPVHLYGQTAAMPAIMALAEQQGLIVIEDAAQAQGATCEGRRSGGFGHAAATSFYPTKNLGALGDGGAILTNDDALAEKIKQLRNYGSLIKYQHDIIGTNSRLDDMQAAILRVKLMQLDADNGKRQAVANLYTQSLAGVGDLTLPFVPAWAESVWHQYVVLTDQRQALQDHLKEQGIGTLVHYPVPPHKQACYPDYHAVSLPIAERMAGRLLSLPISPVQTAEQTHHVIAAIRDFYV
jgi:dTDP-4-amino-4,6-dideoxygalactose transaminase